MKILNAEQIKAVDSYTILNEPVKAIDLMERAAGACVGFILGRVRPDTPVHVFCGMGNNGGDGLAIARLLRANGFSQVSTFLVKHAGKMSDDAKTNLDLLVRAGNTPVSLESVRDLEGLDISSQTVLIDALVGTGLNKSVTGILAHVIDFINKSNTRIISIDVPSGLFIDKSNDENFNIVRADITLTFQQPKLNFLLPSTAEFAGEFHTLDIGLHPEGIAEQRTNHYYITRQFVSSILKPRKKFSHKGNFGHALLIAGSEGKSGATIIAAKGCLRSGAGLLTVHSTAATLNVLLNHLPEAMTSMDPARDHICDIPRLDRFHAVAFGPGCGTHEETATTLKKLLQYYAGDLVIDADGLNILAENKTWLEFLPPDCILTPHPKEFERLTGKYDTDHERLSALKEFSLKHNCIVILKGAHTAIAMPDGNLFFNSTGNPGLAKGGSGDALTGIILGLLARGYTPPKASIIGTYIHGMAADVCAQESSTESILASDVIGKIGHALLELEKK